MITETVLHLSSCHRRRCAAQRRPWRGCWVGIVCGLTMMSTAPAQQLAQEPWIAFPVVSGARTWVSVSDFAAAARWRRQRGLDDLGDLTERFAVAGAALAEISRPMARWEMADAAGSYQVLLIRGQSPADAEQILQRVGGPGPGKSPPDGGATQPTGSTLLGELVFLTDRPAVLTALVRDWRGASGAAAEQEDFLKRSAAELRDIATEAAFFMAWYVDPRLMRKESAEAAAYALRHGLDSITQVGGAAAYSKDRLAASVTRIAAPPRLRNSAAMLQLKPVDSLAMPDWLDATRRGGLLLSADLPVAFSQIAAFFDDTFAAGIEGTYREVLADIREPEGLGLDLEQDLYSQFGEQVFLALTESGRLEIGRMLIAIQLRADCAATVAATVRRMMVDDPEVHPESFDGQLHPLWVYPSAADSWGGVAVVGGYLCFCPEADTLRQLLAAELASRTGANQRTRFKIRPTQQDNAGSFAGVFLSDRQRSEQVQPAAFAPFFDGFQATKARNNDTLQTDWLTFDFLAGAPSGWCGYDEQGWRIVADETALLKSAD